MQGLSAMAFTKTIWSAYVFKSGGWMGWSSKSPCLHVLHAGWSFCLVSTSFKIDDCAKTIHATLYTIAEIVLVEGCVKFPGKSWTSTLLLVERRKRRGDVATLPVGEGGEGFEQRRRLSL